VFLVEHDAMPFSSCRPLLAAAHDAVPSLEPSTIAILIPELDCKDSLSREEEENDHPDPDKDNRSNVALINTTSGNARSLAGDESSNLSSKNSLLV
jgi:hypothetical protein